MRTEIKKFKSLVERGKIDEAKTLLPSVFSVIDKTVQKGIIHGNTAARYKSRLSRQLN
jgi:small subunit ribosomal protein S20